MTTRRRVHAVAAVARSSWGAGSPGAGTPLPRAQRSPVRVPGAFALLALLGWVAAAQAAAPTIPSPRWLLEHVRVLSAPEMEGRASGTPGADRAAHHIARQFEAEGLRPGGGAGGFLQVFEVPTGIRLGPDNALSVAGHDFVPGRDFAPLTVSADGEVTGEVVFAGYGITAPDLGYDDYADVEVRDRIVLVLSGEPRSRDPASPFRQPDAYHYSERRHKVINAREHGARAILLVQHPSVERDELPGLRGISPSWDIPALAVSRRVAERILGPAGASLAELAERIDRTLRPASRVVAGPPVRLRVSLVRERGRTANVVGILPGTDPRLRAEAIVIGAHYDHLGRGGEGSLAPDEEGAVHPGADDNASGVAAVLGLARAFAAAGGAPRTLVFVAFAGEEMGLLGSSHFVRHPPAGLRTVLMVNLDMVGRLRDGRLWVGGVDSGRGLREVVLQAARETGLHLELRGDPFAPSDHTAFYPAGIPVLFFFTGAHADYHRPSDTWDKINAPGLHAVTGLVGRVVAALAAAPSAPAWVRVEAPARRERSAGYGPFFGILPDFGESPIPGVRITGVRPGSPAARAGLAAGDVIVRFAGVTVRTLDDLTFALRSRRPGDRVEVVFVRDGHERRVEAVLEERR